MVEWTSYVRFLNKQNTETKCVSLFRSLQVPVHVLDSVGVDKQALIQINTNIFFFLLTFNHCFMLQLTEKR